METKNGVGRLGRVLASAVLLGGAWTLLSGFGDSNLMAVGQSGAVQSVSPDLNVPPRSIQSAIEGQTLFAASWNGTYSLVGGGAGRVQLVDGQGMPTGTVKTVNGGSAVRAISWNGTNWLVGSDSGRIQMVDGAGATLGTYQTVIQGNAVQSISWNGDVWLVAGDAGRVQRVASDGTLVGTYGIALGGARIMGVAWNGTHWLAGGDSGRVQLVDADGAPVGTYTPALAGGQIEAVSWDGTRFIVAGVSGRFQIIDNSGIPDAATYKISGPTWYDIAPGDGKWMLVGASGQYLILPSNLSSVPGVRQALDNQTAYATTFLGTSWLYGGGSGRVQRIGTNSVPITPYTSVFGTNQIERVAWNGTNFYIVGSAYGQLISPTGQQLTAYNGSTYVLSGGYGARAVASDGDRFLVAGDSGRYALIQSNGTVGATKVSTGSPTQYSVAWTGTRWVTAGASGAIRLISSDGNTTQVSQTGIGGSNIQKVVATGQSIWVFGDYGRYQQFDNNLTAIGGWKGAMSGGQILAAAFNGTEFLVGGWAGFLHRIGLDGQVIGEPFQALEGVTIRGIVWTGLEWVIAGDGGRIQRLNANGTAASTTKRVLDDLTVMDIVYAGPWLTESQICAKNLDCDTASCLGGRCSCDGACLIDGACVAPGDPSPSNPCLVCDPLSNELGWTPATDGTVCGADDACEGPGTCTAGVCDAQPLVDCDDQNPCTDDECEAGTGDCVHTNNTKACSDGDGCTVNDKCAAGTCLGSPKVCNDNNACTIDTCGIVGNYYTDCVDAYEKGVTASGEYWIDPNGGDPADAYRVYCDMETDGGGWTMCYSDDLEVQIQSEVTYDAAKPYGQDGYRTDCRNVDIAQILYVRHDNSQKAWFTRDGGATFRMTEAGYFSSGEVLGEWTANGVASAGIKYQVNVCGSSWMWTGLMVSGYTGGCWKQCNSWCGDTSSAYFRMDGDDGSSYNGVAFNENGHTNVANKLMSVGVRSRKPSTPTGQGTEPLAACIFTSTEAPCDDGKACTEDDVCGPTGVCGGVPVADGATCDDGDACTGDGACVAGSCGTGSGLLGCPSLLAAGQNGAAGLIDPALNLAPKSVQTLIGGSTIYAVSAGSPHHLVAGDSGRVQLSNEQGVAQNSYATALAGYAIYDAAWNGTEWLVGGNGGRVQRVGADGVPIGSYATMLGGSVVRALAWNGIEYLVVGDSGRVQRVAADGTAIGSYVTALSGAAVYGVAWSGGTWLVGGDAGRVQLVAADGTLNPKWRTALVAAAINDVVWTGTGFLVVGASQRSHLIATDGTIIQDSYNPSGGATWYTVATNGSSLLLGGSSGYVRRSNASGGLQGGVAQALLGSTVRGIAWTGNGWLVGGDSGRVQAVATNGIPKVPYITTLLGNHVNVASWGGDRWLVGGSAYTQVVNKNGTAGSTVTSGVYTLSGGYGVQGLSFEGNRWLVVGDSGRYAFVNKDGAIQATKVISSSPTMYGACWNGTTHLAVGASGLVRRILPDTSTPGANETALGGANARVCVPIKGRFLVAGDLGRVQIVGANGVPVGTHKSAVLNQPIYAAATDGERVLVGGLGTGQVQLVDADGVPQGYPVTVLGTPIRAIAWTGTEWIVAGDSGRVRRVSSNLTPIGAVKIALDDLHIYALSAAGPTIPAAGACVTHADCATHQCVAGTCACESGCAADGVCVADGTPNPQNPCEVCNEAVNPMGWSDVVDGTSCSDGSPCVEAGVCSGGTCSEPAIVSCDDGNPCTADSCDPGTGACVYAAAAGSCNDGNPCTSGDACANMVCSGAAVTCNDSNPCTDDSCTPEDGCLNIPSYASCSDGNPCTDGDTCDGAGSCAGTVLADGAACSDGEACTIGDRCVAGTCTGGGVVPACNKLIASGDSGRFQIVPSDLSVPKPSIQVAMSGAYSYGIAAGPTGSLVIGDSWMQQVDDDGVPVGTRVQPLQGSADYMVITNGEEWLVGGDSGRIRRVAADGSLIGAAASNVLSSNQILAGAWNGTNYLVGGGAGLVCLLDAYGVPVSSPTTVMSGVTIRGIATDGTNFLVVGDSGWLRLLGPNGAPLAAAQHGLGGQTANAVAWTGQGYLVVGNNSYSQIVGADGLVNPDTLFHSGGSHWQAVVCNGTKCLAGGNSGYNRLLNPNGTSGGSLRTALDGAQIMGVTWTGTRYLVSGYYGRVQPVASNGVPVLPYGTALSGNQTYGGGWAGDRWMLVGYIYDHVIGVAGNSLSAVGTALSSYGVYTASWNGAHWLVSGDSGRYNLFLPNGNATGGTKVLSGSTPNMKAAAWNGTNWLSCGDSGLCRRIDKNGTLTASSTVLGGVAVRAVSSNGALWITGGDSGRTQLVDAAGGAIGSYITALSTPIRAIAWDGNRWLVAGDSGKVRLIDAAGAVAGAEQTVLAGNHIYGAAWTGTDWVVGGNGGTMQRLLPSGAPVGAVVTVLNGTTVRYVSYGGPSLTPGSACTLGTDCTSGACVAGYCLADCSIGGSQLVRGQTNPDNPCLVCDPDQNTSDWSPLAAGASCEDGDLCTVGDTCQQGLCASGAPKDCGDGSECTVDSCDQQTGSCGHIYVGGGSCPSQLLVAGASGAAMLVGSDLTVPPLSFQTTLGGSDALATSWNGTDSLVVGAAGKVQRVGADGLTSSAVGVVNGGSIARAAAWSGTEWLVGGDSGRVHLVGADGVPVGSYATALGGTRINAMAWGADAWLVGGDTGRIQVVGADGVPIGTHVTAIDGVQILAVAWSGTHWLVGGASGRVQLVNPDGTLAGGYQAAIAGSLIRAAAWDGTRFLVGGDASRIQAVDAAGAPIAGTFQTLGHTVYGVAPTTDGWLAVGNAGAYTRLSPTGSTIKTGTALQGLEAYAVTNAGVNWLVVGQSGRIQRVAFDATLVRPFQTLLGGTAIVSAAWSGSGWLLGGGTLVQVIDQSLAPQTGTLVPFLGSQAVRAVAWGKKAWIAVGDAGRLSLISAAGAPGADSNVGAGNNLLAAAWGGSSWLVGGAAGYVRVIDETGATASNGLTTLGGQVVRAISAGGNGWLVVGDLGRVQRVSKSGTSQGAYQSALFNLTALAASWSGTDWLIGGDSGYIQRIDALGKPVGKPVVALGGKSIRSIAWTGSNWVIAGDQGLLQKVDASGAPVGPTFTVLDGLAVYTSSMVGAALVAGSPCGSDLECPTAFCDEGTCDCGGGCAVGGACVAEGAENPEDPCQVCDPQADRKAWTARADGLVCDDGDACTGDGSCAAGVCVAAPSVDCSDQDPCTDDHCDSETGACSYTVNTEGCDDSNPCTTGDVCVEGLCAGDEPTDCDDGNPCTDDACDELLGCHSTPNEAACDDGNPCSGDGLCSEGACLAGAAVANGTPCSDGAPCNDHDACLDGQCMDGPATPGCANIVVAGQGGTVAIVPATLSVPPVSTQTAIGTNTVVAAAANPDGVTLVGGGGGYVQRVGTNGVPFGSNVQLLGGSTVNAIVWTGDAWLVGGASGRIQRIGADGVAIGSYAQILQGSAVQALSMGDGQILAAGASGRAQRLTLTGTASGSQITAIGGSTIYGAAWSGTHWLVAGDVGRVQLIAADGALASDWEPALAGGIARTVAWSGQSFIVAGDSGRWQLVSADGSVAAATYKIQGTTWQGSVASPNGVLLVGNSGQTAYVPKSGASSLTIRTSILGSHAYAAAWNGTNFLVGGASGRVQLVTSTGVPIVPYAVGMGGSTIEGSTFDGTNYVVVGSAYHEAYDTAGKVVYPYTSSSYTLSGGYGVRSAGHDGTKVLTAGDSGRYAFLNGSYVQQGTTVVTSSPTLYVSVWNGTSWLVGGSGGVFRTLNASGTQLGSNVTLLGGAVGRAAAWNGVHWLVVGDTGRVHRVNASGAAVGSYQSGMLNFTIRAVGWNGTQWLVGGDSGYIQFVGTDGMFIGSPVVMLGGQPIYGVLWTGGEWVIAGGAGYMRRLNPDGTAASGIVTTNDGNSIYTATYGGYVYDAGKPCTRDLDCLSKECKDGFCAADCVIDGVSYLDGALDPTNPCHICVAAASPNAWTVFADGTVCTDNDACTVGDVCTAGACVPGPATDCDDGVECTADSCSKVTGQCSNALVGAASCATCGNGTVDVYDEVEAFETGSLSALGYTADAWQLTTAAKYSGTTSVVSTNQANSSTSTLTLGTTTATGNVCFRVSGSSQTGDKLLFYDGPTKLWEGANLAWANICLPVSAGSHVFAWKYQKDASGSSGEDRYFIDDVSLPHLEACDDANSVSGDGCNGLCTSDELCGTGYTDPWEACDDGNTVAGDGCNADCTSDETCGNGIVDLGEWCDDGNEVDGDGCSPGCQPSGVCGDGALDTFPIQLGFEDGDLSEAPFFPIGGGWVADSTHAYAGTWSMASTNAGSSTTTGVSLTAKVAAGDACFRVKGTSEACCDKFTFLVDGVVKFTGANLDWQQVCTAVTAGSHTFTWRYAKDDSGNAGTDRYWVDAVSLPSMEPEVCDDGNLVSGDGCAGDCKSDESCGNGIVDVTEVCDDGNQTFGDGCAGDCQSVEICGNGVLDFGEQCDDGNLVDFDGCSPLCRLPSVCGNGALETGWPDYGFETGNLSEAAFTQTSWAVTTLFANTGTKSLQTQNHGANSASSLKLTVSTAGGDVCFRLRGTSEACCDKFKFKVNGADKWVGNNLTDWTRICTTLPGGTHQLEWRYEKDGAVSAGEDTYYVDDIELKWAEVCDDGNTVSGDGCAAHCHSDESCGNSLLDAGEVCEDGNAVDGDGCSADCKSLEVCGNGIIDLVEQCDDGNLLPFDGCTPTCHVEAECGNGQVDIVNKAVSFESANFTEAKLVLSGAGGWTIDSAKAFTGTRSARSGNAGIPTSEASMALTFTTSGGDLCFAARGTSEACCDKLLFRLDGSVALSIVNQEWTTHCVPVNAGTHTVQWAYSKNATVNSGEDRYWVDNIVLPPGPGEVCDDGNLEGGDGCSANCQSDETCGNGVVDPGETCDIIPPAITTLAATSGTAGLVELAWDPPDLSQYPDAGPVAGFAVYRSTTSMPTVEGLIPLALTPLPGYVDSPPSQGTWYYRVTSYYQVENQSEGSNQVAAVSDATGPTATIAIAHAMPLGPGLYALTLTASEPLPSEPVLTWKSNSGGPVFPILLAPKNGSTTVYEGTLDVPGSALNGTATFTWQATDVPGNANGAITSGATFTIDSAAPTATVTVAPVSPLGPGTVMVTVKSNEVLSGAPTVSITPLAKAAIPIAMVGSGTNWTGSFSINGSTGDGSATFAFQGTDAVGNVGTTITSGKNVVIDTVAPGAPTGLTATKQPAGSWALSWTAPAGEVPSTYRLYRSTEPIASIVGLTPHKTLSSTSTVDQPPAVGTWYYVVTGVDAAGNQGAPSAQVSVVVDQPPPEDPTNLQLVLIEATKLGVSFTPSANSAGLLAGYRAYRNGALVGTLAANATGYTYEGLSAGSTYALVIRSYDTNNNESLGASLTGHTLYANPVGVVAVGRDKKIDLSWTAVSPTDALQHYAVYLDTEAFTSVAGKTAVKTVATTSTSVTGLVNGTTYWVAVTAVNKSGAQEPAVVAVSAVPGDDVAPEPPTGLQVTSSQQDALVIGWTASANSEGDLTAYLVSKDGVQVASVPAGTHTYTLTGLQAAKSYAIAVRAVDGNDNKSNPASITGYTLMPNPTAVVATPHDKSLGVSWTPPSPIANVASFAVYVQPTSFQSVVGLTPKVTTSASATSATATGLINGKTYFVAVVTVNKSGGSITAVTPVTGVPDDDAPPANPTGLSVTSSQATALTIGFVSPANPDGDLAGFNVYRNGTKVQTLAPGQTSTTLTGLTAATSYTIKVTSFDVANNESTGAQITGYTLIPNPAGLAVTEAKHEKLVVAWTAATPQANIQHYAVYVATSPFTSVTGKTPQQLVAAGTTTASVGGLVNGQTTYIAVVTVNKSLGFDPAVTPVSGVPVKDTSGPSLTNVTYNGAPLAVGGLVAVDGTFGVTATDSEGVSYAKFLVDGKLIGIDQKPSDGLTASLSLDALNDGAHTLHIEAFDTFANKSTLDHAFTAQAAPPAAPVIKSPANNFATIQSKVLITGTAKAKSVATLYVNNVPSPTTATVDAAGAFSLLATLQPGANAIQVTATNKGGESPKSAAINVIWDDSVPAPPKSLNASTKPDGVVRLSWFDDGTGTASGTAGFRIYRSASLFTDKAQATLLNPASLSKPLSWDDTPPADGMWYYGVSRLNEAGTESGLSNVVPGVSDRTLPKALSVVYVPTGAFLDDRFGPGKVDVTITFSEPLLTTPFFSLTPDGGLPIAVNLSKKTSTVFTGSFDITQGTPSGVAQGVLSARDMANNRGTEIVEGGTILIDTDAPSVLALALDPPAPLKNNAEAPITLTVTVELDEALPDEEAPELTWILTTTSPQPTTLPLARIGETTWTGGFTLPADAGVTAEALEFAWYAIDDLGNESTKISGPKSFEVYQGQLPPLQAPLGIVAKALPGGLIQVSWMEVAGAAGYQLYRRSQAETQLSEHVVVTETTLTEDPGSDGKWYYAVASRREVNGDLAVSAPSPEASATADRVPPGPPLNLVVSLAGNGIKLDWLPPSPLSEPITYSIYRAAADQITSLDGLVPLAKNVKQLMVVDPYPSATEHAYAVAAVDAAGNISPPSNSGYLNVGLLPVSSLTIEHTIGEPPVVKWTHPTAGLKGYKLSVDGAPMGLITETTWTDTAFAGVARTYSVTAVDPLDFESVPRSLTLPAVSMAPSEGAQIRKGVIHPLSIDVQSATPVPGMWVYAAINGKQHPSAQLSLPAGTLTAVPVVIGGYPTLPDAAPVTLSVIQTPNVGEKVTITTATTVPTTLDAYSVELQNDKFVRGGTGKARLVFHNTGDQEIELVTATSAGKNASPDVLFRLTDLDGNIMSTAGLKESVGASVLTLGNGSSVARLAPGETYTSAWTELAVPAGAPDQVRVEVSVAKVHWHVGKSDHIEVPGLGTTATVNLVDPPYTALVTQVDPVESFGGQNIVLYGTATLSGGGAATKVPVKVVIAVKGFERTSTVYTDATGQWALTFAPLPGESGVYQAWATHPDVLDKTPQESFVIHRVEVTPKSASLILATNYPLEVPIVVTTSEALPLTNLRVEAPVKPTGMTVAAPVPITVAAGSKTTLKVAFTGDNTAPAQSAFSVVVKSDEGTWATIPVTYTLSQAKPVLEVKPPGLQTGVARGDSVTEVLTLKNKGFAKFANVTLSLLDKQKNPAPAWAFLASAASLGDLQVGQSTQVNVSFAPTQSVALTLLEPYTFYLRFAAQGEPPADIPIYVTVDDSGVGSALFKVTDIYTGTLDPQGAVIEGVKSAKVKLDKVFGTAFSKTLYTDTKGEVFFDALPVGSYTWRASATGHDAIEGKLTVKPGITSSTDVLLPMPLVTIEWEVVETTIKDVYTVVLKATFETDVPAPVVVVEPPSITLPPMCVGQVYKGEYTLTNYGLIKAEALLPTLPNDSEYKFELLVPPPDVLNAKQVVVVPFKVTHVAGYNPEGCNSVSTGSGTGSGSGSGTGDGGDGGGDGGGGGGGSSAARSAARASSNVRRTAATSSSRNRRRPRPSSTAWMSAAARGSGTAS